MSHVAQPPRLRQRIATASTSTEFGKHFRPTAPPPRSGTARSEAADSGLVALLQIAAKWRCRLDTALRAIGLSSAEYSVLQRLAEAGISPTALTPSAASPHGEAGTTAAMEGLFARALIEWQPLRPGDAVQRVRLTRAGRDREAEGARVVDAVSAEFAAAIPKAGGELLKRLGATALKGDSA